MGGFSYAKDKDNIVTITMDMDGPVNTMNSQFNREVAECVSKLEQEADLVGVIIASAKKDFFAGGDLKQILAIEPGDEHIAYEISIETKGYLRRLEKLSVPIVAAINGAALGGGYEICLACNYRVAASDRTFKVGLPEVTLGLLPGSGGVVRLVNLLGLDKAAPYLLQGTQLSPADALQAGMVDELVPSAELLSAAQHYILQLASDEEAGLQPWDRENFKPPGKIQVGPKLAQWCAMSSPALLKKTQGLLPAPEHILDMAVESVRLDFDTALRVESRRFAHLVTTAQAKNLISSFFFQMNRIKEGIARPSGFDLYKTKKVGVIGAGMMGQGIAYVSAKAGIEVVLKDVSLEAAEKGKGYTQKLLDKQLQKGRIAEDRSKQILDRILPTEKDADLSDCDLVIEAVFENIELKKQVINSIQPYLPEDSVWGSNTSSLPISDLGEASARPENFIGIHFFSPVDKMPLVEIICGRHTSEQTLARAYDFTQQIRKTAIVVNDSLGFYTTRVFSTYLDEAVRMLHEGIDPIRIDNGGKFIGMPVGPLAIFDEVSLQLTHKGQQTWKEMGVQDSLGEQKTLREVIANLIENHGRGGRQYGGGFYEYDQDGSKQIWAGLYQLYHKPEVEILDQDIKDRLLFRQVIEACKCLDEGVLRSVAEGNLGSILGIGAPSWTGGFLQFVNTYGAANFVERCEELAESYGERFNAPQIVRDKALAKELFI